MQDKHDKYMLPFFEKLVSHKRYSLIIIILFAVFILMRVAFINADAPQDLSISAAIYTDEGFKTFAARNLILFGDWKWSPDDEYENWASQSPLGTFLYVQVFRIFGISFASIRGLTIAYSIVTMLLLFLFVKRFYDKETAFITLILFGTNFFNIMSSRLGFLESQLNFYLIISLFAFCEMARKIIEKKYFLSCIFFFTGLAGIIAQYFIKMNFIIILVSLLPAGLLVFFKYRGMKAAWLNRIFISVILMFSLVYLVFGHSGFVIDRLYELATFTVFGRPIITFFPLRLFDPIPSFLGKGIYLEFIFLQPLTFAAGIFFSIYVCYGYIHSRDVRTINLINACWLIFGFILISIMAYHPSRYYSLLIIPLIITASSLFREIGNRPMMDFFKMKKPFPFNFMIGILYLTCAVYSGVVLLVQVVPFWMRSNLMRILYPAFTNHNITSVLNILIPIAAIECILIIVLFVKRKSMKRFFTKTNSIKYLFAAILILQIFQYGKWLIFHENSLFEISRSLGKDLPENSVIIGSWSSGFTIENKLRPLIVQTENLYNYKVVEAIIAGNGIKGNKIRDGKVITATEKNIPVYFAVSRNVVFERPIVAHFKNILYPENLIRKVTLGYFDVEIYKINTSAMMKH